MDLIATQKIETKKSDGNLHDRYEPIQNVQELLQEVHDNHQTENSSSNLDGMVSFKSTK